MAYVDFKVTIWERVHIDDESVEKVAEKIKKGIVTCSNDVYSEFDERVAIECEILHETAEQMSLEENDNQSTIELFNANGETICTNEK